MSDRETLEKALAVQESLRGTLPEEIVDTSFSAIQQELVTLAAASAEKQDKHLTILFAELVGFFQPGVQRDLEDVMAILEGGHHHCRSQLELVAGRRTGTRANVSVSASRSYLTSSIESASSTTFRVDTSSRMPRLLDPEVIHLQRIGS